MKHHALLLFSEKAAKFETVQIVGGTLGLMLNISSHSSHELGKKNQHTTDDLYTAHLLIILEFSFPLFCIYT